MATSEKTAIMARSSADNRPRSSSGDCRAETITLSPSKRSACEFEATVLAIAGHDLRQPLQVIQNVLERLKIAARTRDEMRLLRIGENAVKQMTRQLDQLLNALRVGDHGKRNELSPVDLGVILQRARSEHAEPALIKGVEIRLVATRSCIMSDALLLQAIIRNLIDNAVKYTSSGGRILLGCRHMGNVVRIDVIDTGMGISDKHLATVFDAFTRVDVTQGRGFGVGLFIVRQAIAMLGHRLEVSSAAGRGTRFSIFVRSA